MYKLYYIDIIACSVVINQFIPNQHLWDDGYIACRNQSAILRRWLHRV